MSAKTRTMWTFAITSVAVFMATLDNLVVTTALPVIREDLHATVELCLRGTLEMFRAASAGLHGEEALHAIGEAYVERLASDPTYLRSQMQAYAASDDQQIRDVVRKGYGELVVYVERASGLPPERVSHFFAKGMLLNVMASLDLLGAEEGWAQRLIEGCRQDV